jgi:hypothetical protein
VRVVIFGLGTVGRAAAELCRQRPWIELLGVVTPGRRDEGVPEDPGAGVALGHDPARMLEELRPDVVLMATRSSIGDVIDDIECCVERGLPVICTSEELAMPSIHSSPRIDRVLAIAEMRGCAVVATGINPGFIFDALPLVLAGAAWDIRRIEVSRVLDASVFGRSVHRSLGVGFDADEAERAIADRRIRGHVGFRESATLIADSIGVSLTRFEESITPVIATRTYRLREYQIAEGQTAGVRQAAMGWTGDDPWIRFEISLHVDPVSVGWATEDHIRIDGLNPIDMVIRPGTHAVRTTAARLVNTIPAALHTGGGFHTAADLVPAAPWLAGSLPPEV